LLVQFRAYGQAFAHRSLRRVAVAERTFIALSYRPCWSSCFRP